jgi:hypothetical protein
MDPHADSTDAAGHDTADQQPVAFLGRITPERHQSVEEKLSLSICTSHNRIQIGLPLQ